MVTGAHTDNKALRVVFFGTPQFAVPSLHALIASRHCVCGIVTQPDRPRGRGQKVSDSPVKVVAREHSIPVFQPDRLRDADVAATIAGWQPDLGVVAAYGKLIPETLLTVPRFGMINVHASLLPKYRGAAPIHRAIINGEHETGVTIMRVGKRLDAGAMFAKVERPIEADETSDVLERDLADLGARLLETVVDQIATGRAHEEPQDEAQATYAPRLIKEEGLIDWSLPAMDIHNRVRGLYPWPHAYTFLDGARLIVLKTHVHDAASPVRRRFADGEPLASAVSSRRGAARHGEGDAAPGTIVDASRDTLEVATGHGGRIVIEQVQPEGRRPMSTREYLAGRPVRSGARFAAS
jgi:methionyl-tRNA formyltransferase